MVMQPERFIDPFVRAGADSLIAHFEVLSEPMDFVRKVRAQNKQVGLALKPETPVDVLEPYLPHIDVALCMTVHPGFGGQKFLPESPPRIRRLRQLIQQHHPRCELEVDGGIDQDTLPTAVDSGANVLVMGTAIFGAADGPAAAVRSFRSWLENAGKADP
jgi:ribulose-phosphate 3-epimerase